MTQTLTTTEELNHLASSDNQNELTRRLARECLANREAQPVYQMRLLDGSPEQNTWVEVTHEEFNLSLKNPDEWSKRVLFIAPPEASVLAQPVSQGYKLPPHAYRELVNSLRDTAAKYSGTDQLRERLSTALSQFIEPDHHHTRTGAPDRN